MYEPEREVIEILKRNKIKVVSTLPCEKISALLKLVAEEPAFCHVGLNREENGIGISAGVYLAGGKPAMIIQSTGLGNSINAIMSLTVTYGLPLPIIASWRGVYKEKIEAQVPLGKVLPNVLDALELKYTLIEDFSQIGLIEEAIEDAFTNERPHIVLFSPKTWESNEAINTTSHQIKPFKSKEEHQKPEIRRKNLPEMGKEIEKPEMRRYDAIKIITEYLSDEAVITNIGVPSKELYATKDRDLNFYMLGSLSQASSIGLGVSLKTKRETIVLDGDGSLQMSNILPVVADKKPKNLSIFCLDNGTWGSTGDQLTPYMNMELYAMSAGIDIENTKRINTKEDLQFALEHLYEKRGPRFLHVKIKPGPGNAPVENIKLKAEEIKKRFMKDINNPHIVSI